MNNLNIYDKILFVLLIIILGISIFNLGKKLILYSSYNKLKNGNMTVFGKSYPICLINGSIGDRVGHYSYFEFVNKFNSYDIQVVYNGDHGAYVNILENHYISPICIVIDNEIIVPKTFNDYLNIWYYLSKECTINYQYKSYFNDASTAASNTIIEFMLSQDDACNSISDIIIIETLFNNTKPFIYYDKETKNIYVYGLEYYAEIPLILIAKSISVNSPNMSFINVMNDIVNRLKDKNIDLFWFINSDLINEIDMIFTETRPENFDILLTDWEVNPFVTSIWRGSKCLKSLSIKLSEIQKNTNV